MEKFIIAVLVIMAIGFPIAFYYAVVDFERRGCYYTGETRTTTRVEYNVVLKMPMSKVVTQQRYECDEGEGGWL